MAETQIYWTGEEFSNKSNKLNILGADECGYGSIAGMLVVAALRAPKDWKLDGLNDSKKLADKKRRILNEKLLTLVQAGEIQVAYAERSSIEIDAKGVYVALKECYRELAQKLCDADTKMIIDGNVNYAGYLDAFDYETVVKADGKFSQVMGASIVGKVYRDDKMVELAPEFPEYGWADNVGYYDDTHVEAIKKYGRTKHHRYSYKLKVLGEK